MLKRLLGGMATAVTILMIGAPVSAATGFSDPVGDALYQAPGFMDVVGADLTQSSGTFSFRMALAAPIPAAPTLPPPGAATIRWAFPIDSDRSTFPAGAPYASGNGQTGPAEFVIMVWWDGSQFASSLLDRRPLLVGGEPIVTPLAFMIAGTEVRVAVPAALLGSATSFNWGALTVMASAEFGANAGFHFVDTLEPFYSAWP